MRSFPHARELFFPPFYHARVMFIFQVLAAYRASNFSNELAARKYGHFHVVMLFCCAALRKQLASHL